MNANNRRGGTVPEGKKWDVDGQFPIGVFHIPGPADTSYAAYAAIRELNANFVVATNEITTPARTDWALEQAEANGLKMLVTDTGIRWVQCEWIAQDAEDGSALFVRKGKPIGQTFTTPAAEGLNLAFVSFKLGEPPEDESLTLRLTVYDSPAKNELVASSSWHAAAGTRYPEFVFANFPQSREANRYELASDASYYMELSTESDKPIGPLLTSREDAYSGGAAYRGSEELSCDLYFQLTLATPRGGTISAFAPDSRPSDDFVHTFVRHYKDNPALLGYNLIDEPFGEIYPSMHGTTQAIKALDPDRLVYVNHYALNDEGEHYFSLEGTPPMRYEAYVTDWLDTNPDLMSYDYYPFLTSGMDEKVHYQTLEFLREQCAAYGRDLWVYIQSVAYDTFHIAKPTEHEMRFHVYSSLAYGAKGYIYFTYETPHTNGETGFHNGLLLPDGTRNDTFQYAAAINREVLKVGPALLNLTLDQVYHTGSLPPATRELTPQSGIELAEGGGNAEQSPSLIISLFTAENGDKFVMIVSKQLLEQQDARLRFLAKPGFIREWSNEDGKEWHQQKEVGVLSEADYDKETGVLSVSLRPGEGKLYRMEG